MRLQSTNLPQIFHMSLVEPLILAVIIPILGVLLSAWLLIAKPMYIGVYVPIVILILSMLAIFQGMLMPTKIEILDKEIIISYLAMKRTLSVVDINSFIMDEERVGRHGVYGTRAFVTLQLKAGGKVSFKNIKEGNQSLLEALGKWTGLKPVVRNDVIMSYEQEHPMVQNKSDEFSSSVPLNIQTEQLIQKMFPPSEHAEVRQRLIKFGNDFYPDYFDKDKLGDLRLSALKKSKGNLKKLDEELAWVSPR